MHSEVVWGVVCGGGWVYVGLVGGGCWVEGVVTDRRRGLWLAGLGKGVRW